MKQVITEGLAEKVASELRCGEGATIRKAEKRVSSRKKRKSSKVGRDVAHLKKNTVWQVIGRREWYARSVGRTAGASQAYGDLGPRDVSGQHLMALSTASFWSGNAFLLAPVATFPWPLFLSFLCWLILLSLVLFIHPLSLAILSALIYAHSFNQHL